MISVTLARSLATAGVRWRPASGDSFVIDGAEFGGEVFTLSDMTIEAHEFDTGTILGFNGTTEWALDSVALDDALWLPREDQLRDLLGGAFGSLERIEGTETIGEVSLTGPAFRVATVVDGESHAFEATDAADAYARALIALLDSVAS